MRLLGSLALASFAMAYSTRTQTDYDLLKKAKGSEKGSDKGNAKSNHERKQEHRPEDDKGINHLGIPLQLCQNRLGPGIWPSKYKPL